MLLLAAVPTYDSLSDAGMPHAANLRRFVNAISRWSKTTGI
jgi:hypothetical protein